MLCLSKDNDLVVWLIDQGKPQNKSILVFAGIPLYARPVYIVFAVNQNLETNKTLFKKTPLEKENDAVGETHDLYYIHGRCSVKKLVYVGA